MHDSGLTPTFHSYSRQTFSDAFTAGMNRNRLHDLIFMSQLQIFSSGRALQVTLRAAP